MKHLKLFNDTASYDTWKNSEDFVLPNVSYTEDGNLYYNAYGEPVNPNVVCTYNVTDISQETQILFSNGLSCFSSMIVDGVEMDAVENYQFDTVGNHVVEFVLDDPTVIGRSAFVGCSSLNSITIPNSVTSIGEYAFQGCISLTSITIPNSVTSIGNYAFQLCFSLTSITIPNIVTSIGHYAFENCSSLTSITIPNSVTSIGECAFSGCSSLTSITIPNSVNSIGSRVFQKCSNLTSVTIGNSLTSIEDYAFYNCNNLASITCYAPTAPSIKNNTFYSVSNGGTLYVPTGSDYISWMSDDTLGQYNWTIQYI